MAVARTEPKLVLMWNEQIRAWRGGKLRILARLEQGPATNRAINKIAFRYSARILEIRRAISPLGWEIDCTQVKAGLFLFSLIRCSRFPESMARSA